MIGRRAALQIAAGCAVLGLLWLIGYIDITPVEALPGWLRPARTAVNWLSGRDARGPAEAPEALALAIAEYDEPTDAERERLDRSHLVLTISIGGEPAGEVAIDLEPGWAGRNVTHIVRLAESGVLDGAAFIRPCATGMTAPVAGAEVEPGGFATRGRRSRFDYEPSVLIGGVVSGGGSAGDALMVTGEFDESIPIEAGVVGMVRLEDPEALAAGARQGERRERPAYFDTATTRFFVYVDAPQSAAPRLDPVWSVRGRFSLVGRVATEEGLDLLRRIARLEVDSAGRPFEPVIIESAALRRTGP